MKIGEINLILYLNEDDSNEFINDYRRFEEQIRTYLTSSLKEEQLLALNITTDYSHKLVLSKKYEEAIITIDRLILLYSKIVNPNKKTLFQNYKYENLIFDKVICAHYYKANTVTIDKLKELINHFPQKRKYKQYLFAIKFLKKKAISKYLWIIAIISIIIHIMSDFKYDFILFFHLIAIVSAFIVDYAISILEKRLIDLN